jgi:hypothetical protein
MSVRLINECVLLSAYELHRIVPINRLPLQGEESQVPSSSSTCTDPTVSLPWHARLSIQIDNIRGPPYPDDDDFNPTHPAYVCDLNQICSDGIKQQESVLQEYLDPLWEIIGSLQDIKDREMNVQRTSDELKLRLQGITDMLFSDAIRYIDNLDPREQYAAVEHWKLTSERLRLFVASVLQISTRNMAESLDVAKRIWEGRANTRSMVQAERERIILELGEQGISQQLSDI